MPITVRPGTVETRAERADMRAGDVVGKADHAAGLQARGGFQFVHGDDRAGADGGDLALHAVVVEHGFQHAGVFFQRLVGQLGALDRDGGGQQGQRRQFVGRRRHRQSAGRGWRFGQRLTRGGGLFHGMLHHGPAVGGEARCAGSRRGIVQIVRHVVLDHQLVVPGRHPRRRCSRAGRRRPPRQAASGAVQRGATGARAAGGCRPSGRPGRAGA